ncbi:Uncharacterized membrane protein, YccA/Bax inhibitor family [Austwickia chelonae]|uniref:Bax inhibitor-1/YccA family protein n=1 Tax=Austwickia chelonae NBRC 105200 TaxID=1184607 RepID=K6V741_9MICO|nr:Bax inhibitor-1/YccA family protein [Austwickia chelonae]GAB78018.1 hypothetical protein AUCHE_08_02620 [Austwickia chelonae NBRC 105200]SEV94432.1 Uncharacterized membrane protein, YccA/Bax inhibitor family [Austwickia chelonae]
MSNPVFNQVKKQVEEKRYAGFGSGQSSYGQQTQGYGTPGADQLNEMYQQPAAGPVQTGRVTVDDVIMKSMTLFGLLAVATVVSWFTMTVNPAIGMLMWMVGLVGTLGIGIAMFFMKSVNIPLIVTYAVLEGLFVGAISRVFERAFPGVVSTAVLATLCVFGAMFVGWKAGYIKVTARSRRIVGMIIMGYLLFMVINLVFALVSGKSGGLLTFGSPLSIGVSLLVVCLAAYTLAVDFESIQEAVDAGMPEKYSWLLAHGLMVSVVWLYLELLRLIAQLRD